jgi:cytochrome c
MRLDTLIVATIGLILGTFRPISAQSPQVKVEKGHQYATQWCTGCHQVESNSKEKGLFAADFEEIANVRSTTALSLKVFLQSSHNNMPNFILQPDEMDAIAAYILSLRRK